MANSPTEFNEVEFPEYDPTPYSGGFDLAQVYGQSLPPSDKICYPRSTSGPSWSNSEGLSYGSTKPPYGEEPVDSEKPRNGVTQPYEEERPSYVGDWNWPYYLLPAPANGCDCNWESIFSYGYGNGHCFGYGSSHDSNYGYGNGHDQGYGDYSRPVDAYKAEDKGNSYGREEHGYGWYDHGMPGLQPSYHPSHMEPFSGLLGNWPCLSREYGKSYDSYDTDEQSYGNQWKQTADYLFGYLYPYDENRDENYSYLNPPTYCYEQHRNELPQHVQHEYVEPLQFQNPSYYGAYHEEVYPRSKYGDDS